MVVMSLGWRITASRSPALGWSAALIAESD